VEVPHSRLQSKSAAELDIGPPGLWLSSGTLCCLGIPSPLVITWLEAALAGEVPPGCLGRVHGEEVQCILSGDAWN
jgi:hypothetical protein